jgi:hypothetical protein
MTDGQHSGRFSCVEKEFFLRLYEKTTRQWSRHVTLVDQFRFSNTPLHTVRTLATLTFVPFRRFASTNVLTCKVLGLINLEYLFYKSVDSLAKFTHPELRSHCAARISNNDDSEESYRTSNERLDGR